MKNMKMVVSLLLTVITTMFFGTHAFADNPKYTMIDLGLFSAIDVNDNGEVLGMDSSIWKNGAVKHIQTDYSSYMTQFARTVAINNSGQIVGTNSAGMFLYQNGSYEQITRGNYTPYAINNNGEIAGNFDAGAFIWTKGQIDTPQNRIEGVRPTIGYAINSSGTMAGSVIGWSSTSVISGFISSQGSFTDIGALFGRDVNVNNFRTEAYGINDHGDVVGSIYNSSLAYVYKDGNVSILPSIGFGSYATDINNNGHILGRDQINGPIVWIDQIAYSLSSAIVDESGQPHVSDFTFKRALKINEKNQILLAGEGHSYLLTPIPEPASYALMIVGVMFVRWKARRK